MADVAVLGDQIPELAAALELAEVGLRLRVYPSNEAAELGAGAAEGPENSDAVPDPTGALRDLVAHVASPISPSADAGAEEVAAPGHALHLRTVPPVAPLLRGPGGAWFAQPEPAVWGIPAVPLSAAAIALLGGGAALRAALDRVTPVLTIGKTHRFGPLVRRRMGAAVLSRLVEPLSREAMGVAADEIDVAMLTPGLNEAMTRMGTLSGAAQDIAERTVARETGVVPDGGWDALRTALRARLRLYDVEFSTSPASRVAAAETGWLVSGAGDSPVSARALVRGVSKTGSDIAESGDAESVDAGELALGELLVGARRTAGVVAIAAPEFPEAQPEGPAVCAVRLTNGETWSVRLRRASASDSTAWEAAVLGPVRDSRSWQGETTAQQHHEHIREALEAANVTAMGPVKLLPMPFAPYATVAAREHAEQQLEQWCGSQPEELPAGVAIHGGSLARAVEDARSRAITLRRRLAGIAD